MTEDIFLLILICNYLSHAKYIYNTAIRAIFNPNIYFGHLCEVCMGAVYEFEKEKLIIGVIYSSDEVLSQAMEILISEFGEVDLVTEEFSFSKEFSTYYDGELGGEGMRRIYSFRELVSPDRQAEIKIRTNEIEKMFSESENRKINLDPGFISHGRLLLATTKKTGFRIPLSNGIYTELTLFYARGEWHKLPWTYRDYQSERVQTFLKKVRNIYLKQRKEIAKEENFN